MQVNQIINRVRRRLGKVKPQSPSPKVILEYAIDEYQNAVMTANNKGNAWSVKEYTFETVADQKRYVLADLPTPVIDFSKALLIATVPEDNNLYPEQTLEFTQIEQIPKDFARLDSNSNYSLWGGNYGHSARFAAFFYQVSGKDGYEPVLEIRPVPAKVEEYRVLYQVGNFESLIDKTLNFNFPFPDLDFYFTALIAKRCLPDSEWWLSEEKSDKEYAKREKAIDFDLSRYHETYTNYISSLSHGGIVYGDSFADQMDY